MADNAEKDKKDNSFMMKLATLIVDKRKGFYLIFIVLCIFCVLSMNRVKVNNDLTTYLPDTTETRRGLDLMDSEFTTYGSARILICNVTFDEAQKLADQVEEMDGVSMLDFDDTEDHYHDMEALLSVTFDEEADTEATQQHLDEVLDALSDYDVYYSSDIGQEERDADDLNNDMIVILLLAAVVIVAVLLFTGLSDYIYCGSYFEQRYELLVRNHQFCNELYCGGTAVRSGGRLCHHSGPPFYGRT